MKPVKIAQIGTAHDHAEFIYGSISRQDCFDVVGIAAPDGEKIDGRFPGKVLSIDELLAMDDLEAVTIECAEDLSTGIAIEFAKKGVAINLDKPGTADRKSFEELINIVKAKKIPFHTGYMYRYNPLVIRAMELVKSGRLGKIMSVEAQMSTLYDAKKRQWLGKYEGGMMYFLGCHLVDLVLQIMGEPERIIPLNAKSGISGVDVYDYGFAVLEYPSGVSFVKTMTNEIGGFERRQLVICGTEGTVEIKPFESYFDRENIMTDALISIRENGHVTKEHVNTGRFNRYDAMTRDFAECVRGKEPLYSYDYELELFNTVMTCAGM